MANLDNLGYNTYVLGTIRAVTECKRILVFDKYVFMGNRNYSRLNLYNLNDIFFNLLYNRETHIFNEHCLLLDRELLDPNESENIPFEYDCNNLVTNGFNIIIYLSDNNTPTGYTEFLNTQGRISEYVRIYLKFKIEINQVTIELNNSLYKTKNRLTRGFIGSELNKFSSSSEVKSKISKLPKDQKYTSHLSEFLRESNTSNIFLGDRTLLHDKFITKLDLIHDTNIFDGEEYSNYQIGYYQNDIVLYSWTYINDPVGYYYRITSLITQNDYKYTRFEDGIYKDIIEPYDSKELSKTLLYCAGKYLIFKINYGNKSIRAAFDTTKDSWVYLNEPNVVIDPLDRRTVIHELPRSTSIQSYDTALELFPEISDVFLDIENYIQGTRSLDIVQKIGDWFVLKDSDLYLYTCPSMSVYMTSDEYNKCIVINNNTILIKYDDYYVIYHGPKNKTYYTEKARCLLENLTLTEINIGDNIFKICNDENAEEYLDYYKKSEIAIVFKSNSFIFENILDSYRHQPLYDYNVPSNIIGAIGGLVFYINQYNNINYI